MGRCTNSVETVFHRCDSTQSLNRLQTRKKQKTAQCSLLIDWKDGKKLEKKKTVLTHSLLKTWKNGRKKNTHCSLSSLFESHIKKTPKAVPLKSKTLFQMAGRGRVHVVELRPSCRKLEIKPRKCIIDETK